jgi:hypothetical protein
VNLCQPLDGRDRAVASFCAGAFSGTCGDMQVYCGTSSSVAPGHLGTSRARRQAHGTSGRIRDVCRSRHPAAHPRASPRHARQSSTGRCSRCASTGSWARFANRA